MLLQTLLLVIALGIDAFVCSFSYGVNQIKVPLKSMLMINLVTLTLLLTGAIASKMLSTALPQLSLNWLAPLILIFLGLSKIFEGVIKALINQHKESGHVEFSLFNFGFILRIYADYQQADIDESKELSIKESIPLAFALGIDGLSVGFSIGLTALHIPLLLGMSLIVEAICIFLGGLLGQKAAKKMSFDFSFLSGCLLIAVALFKFLS